jgi:uncharacterized protein YbbK (DUF523 family)
MRIGVSACLLGENVRYDGRLKTSEPVRRLLAALHGTTVGGNPA